MYLYCQCSLVSLKHAHNTLNKQYNVQIKVKEENLVSKVRMYENNMKHWEMIYYVRKEIMWNIKEWSTYMLSVCCYKRCDQNFRKCMYVVAIFSSPFQIIYID